MGRAVAEGLDLTVGVAAVVIATVVAASTNLDENRATSTAAPRSIFL